MARDYYWALNALENKYDVAEFCSKETREHAAKLFEKSKSHVDNPILLAASLLVAGREAGDPLYFRKLVEDFEVSGRAVRGAAEEIKEENGIYPPPCTPEIYFRNYIVAFKLTPGQIAFGKRFLKDAASNYSSGCNPLVRAAAATYMATFGSWEGYERRQSDRERTWHMEQIADVYEVTEVSIRKHIKSVRNKRENQNERKNEVVMQAR